MKLSRQEASLIHFALGLMIANKDIQKALSDEAKDSALELQDRLLKKEMKE